ncbi:MAG: class I tRNA ligase family protein, partial [Promethearchaeota archaeon]
MDKLDLWILSRTHSTIKKITKLSDKYLLPWVTDKLRDLIVNDISRWYIMLNREKLDIYSTDPKKHVIMALLFDILYKFLLMLAAPVNPMLTEEIYLKMFKSHIKSQYNESIHLQDWPKYDESLINEELEKQMKFTRDLIEDIRALKDENKIRLRWPNKRIIIEPKEGMPEITFPELIKQVGNVKALEIKESVKESKDLLKAESKYYNIYLDTSLDDDLLSERIVNDLIRNIQFTRKKSNYQVGEEITLKIGTKDAHLKSLIEMRKDVIAEKVTAKKFVIEDSEIEQEDDAIIGKLNVCPNDKCFAVLKDNVAVKLQKKAELNC